MLGKIYNFKADMLQFKSFPTGGNFYHLKMFANNLDPDVKMSDLIWIQNYFTLEEFLRFFWKKLILKINLQKPKAHAKLPGMQRVHLKFLWRQTGCLRHI